MSDIQFAKSLGMNMLRKHIKVGGASRALHRLNLQALTESFMPISDIEIAYQD